jgi:hypothetical protein
MREDFRDYFGWAIMGDVWDTRMPSKCSENCSNEYEMCCFQVSMKNRDTQIYSYESYCMYQDAALSDFNMEMFEYEIEMVCDKESSKPMKGEKGDDNIMGWIMGDLAVHIATGFASATLIMTIF